MKKQYIQPDATIIKLTSGEILTVSTEIPVVNDEILINGDDLFN